MRLKRRWWLILLVAEVALIASGAVIYRITRPPESSISVAEANQWCSRHPMGRRLATVYGSFSLDPGGAYVPPDRPRLIAQLYRTEPMLWGSGTDRSSMIHILVQGGDTYNFVYNGRTGEVALSGILTCTLLQRRNARHFHYVGPHFLYLHHVVAGDVVQEVPPLPSDPEPVPSPMPIPASET
jgi:hypothetical protein